MFANIAERWLKWHVAPSIEIVSRPDERTVSEIPQLNKGRDRGREGGRERERERRENRHDATRRDVGLFGLCTVRLCGRAQQSSKPLSPQSIFSKSPLVRSYRYPYLIISSRTSHERQVERYHNYKYVKQLTGQPAYSTHFWPKRLEYWLVKLPS